MEYFKIGKLVAAFGVQGELILKHSLGKKSNLKDVKALFIEQQKQSFLPWFITATKIKSEDETFIQLEGVTTREAALKLTQKEVWVQEEIFQKLAASNTPLSLLGFHIIDQGKDLGPILEVIEQPHQLIGRLEINDKEVLVPLHEQFLQKIDKKKRQVLVNLPDGLLDIYLDA